MQLILTGEMIGAEEAHRLGLVNEVYPAAELEARTMELAAKVAEKSPVALAMAKASVKNAARMNLRDLSSRRLTSRPLLRARTRKRASAPSSKTQAGVQRQVGEGG